MSTILIVQQIHQQNQTTDGNVSCKNWQLQRAIFRYMTSKQSNIGNKFNTMFACLVVKSVKFVHRQAVSFSNYAWLDNACWAGRIRIASRHRYIVCNRVLVNSGSGFFSRRVRTSTSQFDSYPRKKLVLAVLNTDFGGRVFDILLGFALRGYVLRLLVVVSECTCAQVENDAWRTRD